MTPFFKVKTRSRIFLPSYTQTQLNWRHIQTSTGHTISYFSVYAGQHCKCTDTRMSEGFSGLYCRYIHSLGKASSRHPLIYILYSLSRPAYQHQRGSVSLFCVSDSISYLCLSDCLSLSAFVFDCISVCFITVSLSVLCLTVSSCLSMFFTVSLSVWLSFCLCLSVCVCDCIYVCLCVSLSNFVCLCD